jgi:hypothetical protein
LKNKILEYIELVELAIVQIIRFCWRWTLFFYVELHENKIMKLINHAFGTCHSYVKPKILHFAKLSFWSSYSKLKGQQNLVRCKKLMLELLSSCFFICILPNIYLLFIYDICLTFGFLDNW